MSAPGLDWESVLGELFSRFVFLFSLSDFGEFSATLGMVAVGFLGSRMAGHMLGDFYL